MDAYGLQMAKYASALQYDRIPREVTEWVKVLVLDTLGVAVFGSHLPWCRTVIDYSRYLAGPREATLWGSKGEKVAAPNAALANGTCCHCFELDETHRKSWLHAFGVTLPPALAIGEGNGLTGKELIAVLVAAVDINIRVAMALNIEVVNRYGLHPTGGLGHFGAAIAASKALRLPAEQMARAFGLAGSRAMGTEIIKVDGSHLKRLYSGRAAHNGVESALLAKMGFEGPLRILEGEYGGIFDVLWGVCDQKKYDYGLLTQGLGDDFSELLQIGIKPYPLHLHTHPSVDLALDILKGESLDWKSIKSVEIRTRTRNVNRLSHRRPATVMLAQQSIPYAVSAAFVDGAFGVDQLSPEKLQDENILEFSEKKVFLIADEAMDRAFPEKDPAEMVVKTSDGRVFTKKTNHSRGNPESPLSLGDIKDKFHNLAGRVLPKEQLSKLEDAVLNLEKCTHVGQLTSLLCK